MNNKLIYTIGHSNRHLDELVEVLKHHSIEILIDVRHFPRSERNPQFNREAMKERLQTGNIEYIWMRDLGGYRTEGYQEYMKSDKFREAIDNLTTTAETRISAVMCAEYNCVNCHRRLIASFLHMMDWKVVHIFDENRTELHDASQPELFQSSQNKFYLY